MEIKAKMFSSNWETYKKFYKDVIKRAYQKDGVNISLDNIQVELEYIDGDTIQAQRAPSSRHSRTISVYEDNKIKYIIGLSNTGYDEDRKKEHMNGGKTYNYGNSDYHSNTYLCQGINKIFELYYDTKKQNPEVKLYFYLLDVGKKTYPDNLSNNLTYRELYTLGFEILNIDLITFHDFEQLGFSIENNGCAYAYTSFNKFANDILFISKKNRSNEPAYLKCIDLNFDISKEKDIEDNESENTNANAHLNKEYIYTFKTLGAQSYDSFLTMWTLNTLADRENKNLKFLFSKEKFNFRLNQLPEDAKFTEDFPETITRLFEKIGIDIKYETADEVRQQYNREISQYMTAKCNNTIRNQELFKNNMRQKGIQTKCCLCGCEVEEILEAAHLWGVSEIKNANAEKINSVLSIECMKDLIDVNTIHFRELFYKKYVLANSGDNGVWLCSNHHGLFDKNFYCFNSEDGMIIIKNDCNEIFMKFMESIMYHKLPKEILTDKTKVYLQERTKVFSNKNR